MCAFQVNAHPAMTRHLVKAKIFANDPVVIVDVGARGGFNDEWWVFGDAARIYCFEPDEAECAVLAKRAPDHVTYIPEALAAASGRARLYRTKLPWSAGLYKTNAAYFGRLLNRDNALPAGESEIAVTTLSDVVARYGIPAIDFVKLDAEGAELDILKGVPQRALGGAILGVLSEVRFQREINHSPNFAELDVFLHRHGLSLFDLQFHRQSRHLLPYPQLDDYRLPTGERFFAYTTRGQIQDGDALYFRDLLIPANEASVAASSPRQILKLCALFEIYSLNDCAAELISTYRDRLRPLINCDTLLDLLTRGVNRRFQSFDAYVGAYFRGEVPHARTRSLPSRVAGLMMRCIRALNSST